MTDATHIVFVQGVGADDLRRAVEAEIARWGRYRGIPIIPAGCHEVQIIELTPQRIEPDIEDEP